MSYKIGQKVCLWQIKLEYCKVTVLKEIIVTVTKTKTGAPGEFSQKPSSLMSLKGVGDDGKTYDKHWEVWPESQTNDFSGQWSIRDDSGEQHMAWIPFEACHVYNDIAAIKKRTGKSVLLVDKSGLPILPKGEVEKCDQHDRYWFKDAKCIFCRINMP